MKLLADKLYQLQLNQLHHDERFHKEVVRLPVHQRINHMALHFAKYSGQLASEFITPSFSKEQRSKLIIDCFAIAISSVNILNVRISDRLLSDSIADINGIPELAAFYAEELVTTDKYWLLLQTASLSGKIAKACESLDHLEAYDYRENFLDGVIGLIKVYLAAAHTLDIDIETALAERLLTVKKKSIFFEDLQH
ncbi:hypothetical protein [Marinobacter sp.]|uniref:hypothetical protein n=2 Tax=Marinobacter sp. TaxID=50741 RepID=UPI000C57152E|nr:hypothetical protein [Marinobacter sp.]MBP54640.1 hypothetical protein [Marinobacter sp.]|tara:strand:+ start:352 stop:936 length:585 start_codon:yes stop_codon:yes gene_type:complete